MKTLSATVRLQFHEAFTLTDALDLVDYFHDLGVSHIYASPLTRARKGSTHGYDTVDYHLISPELGGESALRALVAKLRERGMGLILDIVPNHMGVSPDNSWWWSVLRDGCTSLYANYFDIDWDTPDPTLRGKLLAPYLGDPYGKVLSSGDLRIERDPDTQEFHVAYFDARFPISRDTAPEVEKNLAELSHPYDGTHEEGRTRLHRLLEAQHYRLAWWRCAAEEINWRRFFEISDLAGMRAEQPAVREDIHRLFFRLYAEGLVDGLRIDHIDGLADPRGYGRYLRGELEKLTDQRPPDAPRGRPYVIVEKILAAGEPLALDWEVDGTTGYDFMTEVGEWLHEPEGEPALTELWQHYASSQRAFGEMSRSARRQLISQHFAGEFDALSRLLHRIAQFDLMTRDWSLSAIRRALTELLVHFPVYRTYADNGGRTDADQAPFDQAMEGARQTLRGADHEVLELVGNWLGGQAPADYPQAEQQVRLKAIRRFQQLTSPLAAKSVEDTGFYRYGRLLSRNEVGSDPANFALSSEALHARTLARARDFPHAMLATATHDHKRGEDGRAQLAVLSERPEPWRALVQGWMARHARFRSSLNDEPAPLPADEYMLYQTLVGAWPPSLSVNDEEGIRELAGRISEWQTKSLREAKLHSSWIAPDDEYENACNGFLFSILDARNNRETLFELSQFLNRVGPAAAVNSLAQTLLRLTMPGVPDLYQGTELWDFSMVDPDNRRPVDYALRRGLLQMSASPAELVAAWRGGRIKFDLIHRVMNLRSQQVELFRDGGYVPLEVQGSQRDHVFAFARCQGERWLVVVVPHRIAGLLGTAQGPLVPADAWGDTSVVLPVGAPRAFTQVLTGAPLASADGRIVLSVALQELPVAVLT